MPFITGSRDDDSLPLFAPLLRENDLHSKLVQRTADFEATLEEALRELANDCFATSLGKFREAIALSQRHPVLEQTIQQSAVTEAGKLVGRNWRVAQALLQEVTQVPKTLLAEVERQKRQETIQAALDESSRAEYDEYLLPVRNWLAELAKTYRGDEGLESGLHFLDGLWAQRVAGERDKNLSRLKLFLDRVDNTEKPETLHRFRELVAPFADPYVGDDAFTAVLDDFRSHEAAYDMATRFLAENHPRACLQVCEEVLAKRPSSVLFRRLEEKAKGREWVTLLTDSTVQRARAFEQEARYAEAVEEWESLRAIDPHYPGLESEILRCTSGESGPEDLLPAASALEEPLEAQPGTAPAPPSKIRPAGALPLGLRIAITEEAWNHLKTGLAATMALLLVVLMLASNSRP